jgi:hypothetical protein
MPSLPVRLGPPPAYSTLKVGDWIELYEQWRDLKGNEVGQVTAIRGDRHADIKICDPSWPTGWKIRTIPYTVFKLYISKEEQEKLEKMRKEDIIEGEVLSKVTTDMSQVTKLEERKSLAETACMDDLRAVFEERYH